MNTKICKKCNCEKNINQFQIRSDNHKRRHICIECRKNQTKKYYLKERRKILIKQAKYRKENKEKCRETYKKHYLKNKDNINYKNNQYRLKNKDWFNKYWVRRRKNDIGLRILHALRSRLNHALKGQTKSKHTQYLLGCSVDELKSHIQSQFQSGMTWGNYGLNGWTIDHIIPCDSFNLINEDEQKKCFHYSNLQPLWQKDNRKKWNKLSV